MPRICVILAADEGNGIGYKGQLPWPKMKHDMQRFQKLTKGGAVIMGRKTYESLGKPLKDRLNIVISRSATLQLPEGVLLFNRIEDAIEEARWRGYNKQWLIGGAQLLQEHIHLADALYITRINHIFPADTHLSFSLKDWKTVKEEEEHYPADEYNPYPYSFFTYLPRESA